MVQDRLRELLARAREPQGLDGESHQLFSNAIRDLEIALGSGRAAAQAPRLESLAARFEAAHPRLADTLRELIDILVKAGI
jgi:hypothetical protein